MSGVWVSVFLLLAFHGARPASIAELPSTGKASNPAVQSTTPGGRRRATTPPPPLAIDPAALEARVAKLEGQIQASDLVGSYALNAFQVELNSNNQGRPSVSSYVLGGTVVLSSNGTFSFSTSENGNELLLGTPPSMQPFQHSNAPFTSTWTYAGGTVTLQGLNLTLSAAMAGRVLISSGSNHSDGTNVIVILTRL